MSGYWAKRQQKIQAAIADKTIAQTEKQLAKYYKDAMKKVIEDFEAVYDKILASKAKDEQVTPADMYKLDKYWQAQAQLKQELQKLGDKEAALLSKEFEKEWEEIYEATSLPSDVGFATVSAQGARAMIDTVWLNDGKNFSQRIWGNTEKLAQTLNEQLVHCVVTGKKTTELRDLLINRFNVSLTQANTLIRTEAAHIQIEASKQRYQDYGMEKYEFFADTDERTCTHGSKGKSCKELDGKIFLLSEMQPGVNAPPMHPRCRCAVLPVIDDEREKAMEDRKEEKNAIECPICGKKSVAEDGYLMCKSCMKELKDNPYAAWLAKQGFSWKDAINATIDDDYYEKNISGNWLDLHKLYKKQEGIKAYGKPGGNSIYIGVKRKPEDAKLREGMERLAEIEKLSPYEQNKHYFVCIDCGKIVLKSSTRANRSERCPDCYEAYRKAYKAENEKKRRKRKKKNK